MTALRIDNMPAEAYHAKPHLSKSGMSELLRSPAHYQAWLKSQNQQTQAMAFGTLAHTATLEPDVFSWKYVEQPDDIDFRTKAGKEWKAAIESDSKIAVKSADYQAALGIRNAVMRSPVGLMLKNCAAEVSYFIEGPVPMKARVDHIDGERIIDIKTTTDATERAFMRTVSNFKYHLQAAHYMALTGARDFIFVAVETDPPYAVGLYWLDDAWIAEGQRLRDRAIQIYQECSQVDAWPAYSVGFRKLSMPAWAVDSTTEE